MGSKQLLTEIKYGPIAARGLTEETTRLWRYGWTTHNGEAVQVAQHVDELGQVFAQKTRTSSKDFRWYGDTTRVSLYGKWLWRDHGKMVVITEGEIDALSVSQAQGNKWPVVSVPNGASSAAQAVRQEIEWLEKFERVVFLFDMDKPGQEAALECASMLSPGRAFIASLPLKDANEMLVAGRSSEIIDAIWGAKQYRPDGVLTGTEVWDRLLATNDVDAATYPWAGLQAMTGGIRHGEIVVVTAGTGIGKSETVRHIAAHLHDYHKESVGYIALEESVERTALGIVGLRLGKRIHMDRRGVSEDELRQAFADTVGSGRYYLYDHWGSLDSDHLLSRIRFMVRGCGCGTIILDHLSIVVSGLETDDERRTIDRLMTRLRSLVQELRFRLIVVNHLRRVERNSHEEGGRVQLSHLRGSGAIGQLADMVIALERDQQGDSQNQTCVRVLKNRYSGMTGVAGTLEYDHTTGRMIEIAQGASEPGAVGEEAPPWL